MQPASNPRVEPSTGEQRQAQYEYNARQFRVYVTALYDHHGRRRGKEDLTKTGLRAGHIHIVPCDPGTIEGRPTRRARLVKWHPAQADPYFGELYDPQIVYMDASRFILRGFSLQRSPAGTAITTQAWLVEKCLDNS